MKTAGASRAGESKKRKCCPLEHSPGMKRCAEMTGANAPPGITSIQKACKCPSFPGKEKTHAILFGAMFVKKERIAPERRVTPSNILWSLRCNIRQNLKTDGRFAAFFCFFGKESAKTENIRKKKRTFH